MGIIENGKKFIQGVKRTFRNILKTIKFFLTPLGTIVGWILLIIFIAILLYTLVLVGVDAIQTFFGGTNYEVFDGDLEVLDELYSSNYESVIDAENFQNFKAFEYAVLMDTAEYIRNSKQEAFDVYLNEGEFAPEREELSKHFKEEYNGYMEALSEEYADADTAAIKLMNVVSDTDQSLLSDEQLKSLIASTERNVSADEYIKSSYETKGGNNRVNGPYLVYEFRNSSLKLKNTSEEENTDTSVEENKSGDKKVTTIIPVSNVSDWTKVEWAAFFENPYSQAIGTLDDLLKSGDIEGGLEPYIYVPKEEVRFSYYFDGDDELLEYSLYLNANNSSLSLGDERDKDIDRAFVGITPRAFPGTDYSSMTQVPLYSDVTTATVYKIPLRTLIGRYLPKAELLQAWAILKEDVIPDNQKKMDVVDELIAGIKGIYNEVCLLDEDTKVVSQELSGEVYNYAQDLTNKNSFVTFEKAGIERTVFDIDGLVPLGSSDIRNIKVVSGFGNAIFLGNDFEITYTVDGVPQQKSFGLSDFSSKELEEIGLAKGGYVVTEGNEIDGYELPNGEEDLIEGYYASISTGDNGGNKKNEILSRLKEVILRKLEIQTVANVDDTSLNNGSSTSLIGPVIEIESGLSNAIVQEHIFTVKTLSVNQKLEVRHVRMPILLVSSASTWSRNVAYDHKIFQNAFKQNNKNYIIPRSVSSIGLMSLETTLVEGEEYGYRGKAFNDIFYRMKEEDVILLLVQLEAGGINGVNECYDYMRDTYKLLNLAKEYSQTANVPINQKIHINTYDYVYIPETVLKYDDSQTQKIYWLNLMNANGSKDEISKEELENMKSKDNTITWQVLEYDKYPECEGRVYALFPFGSAYARAYMQMGIYTGQTSLTGGMYRAGWHEAVDWSARAWIDEIMTNSGYVGGDKWLSTTGNETSIGKKIYDYEFSRMNNVYGSAVANSKINTQLISESSNMPIVAIAPGRVETVGFNARSGFYVVIKHSDQENVVSKYVHLKRWPEVTEGDYVGAGTLLGYEGNTGRSMGSHLHFAIQINGASVDPREYIMSIFNPFYYKEKALEEGYNLESEYMSLYRTVSLVGNGNGYVSADELTNVVPNKALVSNIENLIQMQGTIEREIYMSGELDWTVAKDYTDSSYVKYLERKQIYDLYIDDINFDKKQATLNGYLNLPIEISSLMSNDVSVNTKKTNSLPKLTRDELEHILKYWVEERYSGDEVTFLRENIFTQENISTILELQNNYDISAVFLLAAATQETNLGVNYLRNLDDVTASPDNCNLYAMSKSDSQKNEPDIIEINGEEYVKYSSYNESLRDFANMIALGNGYYRSNRYELTDIGKQYRSKAWGNQVLGISLEILEFYTGNDWNPTRMMTVGGDCSSILGSLKTCKYYYYIHKYGYGGRSTDIPPYGKEYQGDDFINVTPAHGKDKFTNGSAFSNASVSLWRADCVEFVSWGIYECARANGLIDVAEYYSYMDSIPVYRTIGNLLSRSKTYSIGNNSKLMLIAVGNDEVIQAVRAMINGQSYLEADGSTFSDLAARPGDIIVQYERGYNNGNEDLHHVEFIGEVTGDKVEIYSVGGDCDTSKPGATSTRRPGNFRENPAGGSNVKKINYLLRFVPNAPLGAVTVNDPSLADVK